MKARGPSLVVARIAIGFFVLLAVGPILWTFLNAFKNRIDITTPTPMFFFKPTLANFSYVLGREEVRAGLWHSLVVTCGSVFIGALFGLPTAYAAARYATKRAADIQFFVLSLRFLPPVAVAIPLMVLWLKLGLYDTQIALIITYSLFTISTVVWLATPSFQAVPRQIEEAAIIDGYGPYAVFFRIALPIAARSLTGAIAFSFVLVWNEFLIALMLTTSDAKTLPVVASELTQLGLDVPWGILNASVILLSLPPLMLLGVLSGFMNRIIKKNEG